MPPPLIIQPDQINTDKVLYDRAAIYSRMPHRFEFEMLDAICLLEGDLAAAYLDCREDAWWVRGHVPGRPIFPGVLQLEAAAHLVAFATRYVHGGKAFVGFGGVDACRFREMIIPPARLVLVARVTDNRPRRVRGDVQGLVDGRLAFQASIAGMAVPDPS